MRRSLAQEIHNQAIKTHGEGFIKTLGYSHHGLPDKVMTGEGLTERVLRMIYDFFLPTTDYYAWRDLARTRMIDDATEIHKLDKAKRDKRLIELKKKYDRDIGDVRKQMADDEAILKRKHELAKQYGYFFGEEKDTEASDMYVEARRHDWDMRHEPEWEVVDPPHGNGIVDIAKKLMYGRNDEYQPKTKVVLDKYQNDIITHIELHRNPLNSLYMGLLHLWTADESRRRLKEQPKDKLFHISMWVTLQSGKVLCVEKNEAIAIYENPKKAKEEEIQPVPNPPSNLTLGEMLSKTQQLMGDRYFRYSAMHNNCGNYIEAILKANGMATPETNNFIGQDAVAILQGYPTLRKVLNTITDIASRTGVVLQGAGPGASSTAKLVKGSPEMKAHMKALRDKRKS